MNSKDFLLEADITSDLQFIHRFCNFCAVFRIGFVRIFLMDAVCMAEDSAGISDSLSITTVVVAI